MLFLIFSVICSVLVSVQLKLAQRKGIATTEAIAWNYLAAASLCWLLLDPPLNGPALNQAPAVSLAALALLLPGIFLAMAASVKVAGIVRTDIAQRLSLVLSLLAAFLLFGEKADALKITGLVLGLAAIVCLVARSEPSPDAARSSSHWLLPLVVLVGYASVDILLKRIAISGTPFAVSLLIAFAVAFVLMMAMLIWRRVRHGHRFTLPGLLAGLLLGATNFGNILFYVRAHQALPNNPAVVFSMMNIGVVVLGTLAGVVGFGERLSRLNKLAIPLAVVAILLIAMSLRG
ncbi:EamA/RhaT family transporter [Pseudoxanthomonas sp. UTMC 1351]|uniref:EamA family transporter n=1 Tax=Pseudoxanthomonas sp. UTMC 1351 TaxID=2695853 RepID=UPI0034CF3790